MFDFLFNLLIETFRSFPFEQFMTKMTEHESDSYYMTCVNHFDDERKLFQKNIEFVTPNASELHLLDWDSRQRREDIEMAKVELDAVDQEVSLHSRRFTLARERLDDGKTNRTSRQKQIQLLSELQQPVEHDVTYCYNDRHPDSRSTSANVSSKFADPAEVKKMISRRYRTGEIVKLENQLTELNATIAKNTGALMLKVVELRSGSAKSDATNNDEVKGEYAMANQLITELHKTDLNCFSTVSEILKLRLKIMVAQRREVEETDRLHRDKEYFEEKEQEARRSLIVDTSTAKKRLDKELGETTKEFKRQLLDLDKQREELRKVGVKNEKTKTAKKDETVVLKERYTIVRKRYETLRRRHALEMEGFNNEASILRRKIKSLQKSAKQAKAIGVV